MASCVRTVEVPRREHGASRSPQRPQLNPAVSSPTFLRRIVRDRIVGAISSRPQAIGVNAKPRQEFRNRPRPGQRQSCIPESASEIVGEALNFHSKTLIGFKDTGGIL